MKAEWIPMWKEEYDNDLAKINQMVANHLLYQIAEDLVGGVNEVNFKNESKNPTNHFQMEMYLGNIILFTSPFIYVDNNHKVISNRTNIEVLDENYDTLKQLKETDNPQSGKSSPYGSGYSKLKKIIQDILNEQQTLQNISFKLHNITDNEYKVTAELSGNIIGTLYFIKSKHKPVLIATLVSVTPSFRRKGIGSRMYQFAEKELGNKFIKSDEVLTPGGKALWSDPNRKFGLNDLDEDESLRKWFKRSGTPGKEGGWVDCNAPIRKDGKITGYKPCGRKEGEKRSKYPSCRPTAAKCKDPGKGTKWGKTK
jgi:hypothetical protein